MNQKISNELRGGEYTLELYSFIFYLIQFMLSWHEFSNQSEKNVLNFDAIIAICSHEEWKETNNSMLCEQYAMRIVWYLLTVKTMNF